MLVCTEELLLLETGHNEENCNPNLFINSASIRIGFMNGLVNLGFTIFILQPHDF